MLKSLRQGLRELQMDERGAFSIKTLAIAVAVIVVIGAVVGWLGSGGGMQEMIEQVWEALGGWLEETIGIGW